MADDLGSLIVRIGMDGTNFDKGITNLNSKMKLAQSELKASQSSFKNFGNSIDGLKSKHDGLSKVYDLQGERVKQLKKRYDEIVKTQGENSVAAEKVGRTLNSNIAYYNRLGGEVESVKGEIKDLSREIDKQNSFWGKSEESLKSFGDRAGKVGQSMKNIGQNLAMSVTLPIVGIGTAAVKTAMDFEAQMDRVGAIAGATGGDLKKLNDQALELGANTSKSASEVAKGMEELAAMGFEVNDIMGAMPGVIAASEASGADMAQTAELMASTMNAFGLETSQATRIADVLAQSANQSAADITDLQYSFKYAAPVAKMLGISMEGLAAATGIMADAGIKGETAGTSLRGALLRLSDPPAEAEAALEDLGITIKDSTGNMKPFSQIIGEVGEKTEGMGNAQKAAALKALFGVEAVSGMLAVIEAGPEKLDKLTKGLEESGGASKEAADKMKDNLKGSLEELGGAFETAAITIGNTLIPIIRDFSGNIQELVEKFQNLSPETQNTILALAGVAAAAGPLLLGFGTIASGVGGLATAFSVMSGSIATAGGVMAALASPIGIAVLAIAGIATAVAGGAIAFAALDKEMDKPIVKSDIFAGKISDATKDAYGSYHDLQTGARAELELLANSSGDIASQIASSMVKKYAEMGDQVLNKMKGNHAKQLEELTKYFADSNVLTEEEENKRIKMLMDKQKEEVKAHQDKQDRIMELLNKAASDKYELTSVEIQELRNLTNRADNEALKHLVESQEEQVQIRKNMKDQKVALSTEETAEMIRLAIETRDNTVDEAKKMRDEKIKEITKMKEEGIIQSQEESYEYISEAQKAYVGVLTNANAMRDDTIQAAKERKDANVETINLETGEILTGWDNMYNGVITAVNWIRKLFGKDELQKSGDVRDAAKQGIRSGIKAATGYAKGTPSSGHPGGAAIVGEEGRELAHIPGQGVTLLGSKGPELIGNLPRGSSVLPNKHTERLLKNYGFPGYAEGIGDYFDMFLEGPNKVWDFVKDKFELQDFSSILDSHTGSPLEYVGNMATDWIKETWDSFFGGLSGEDVYHMGLEKDPNKVGAGGGFGGMMKYIEPYYNMVKDRFGPTRFMGAYNNRNVRGGSSKSMHAYGRAFDIGGSHETMSAIAEYLRKVNNAQHIIYNRRISSNGGAWRPYDGVNPHTDHVHADFKAISGELANAGGGSGVEQWRSLAAKALAMKGQYSEANLNRLLMQMNSESSGNAKAINNWDSNAKRGTPSKGLMQVIDPTFRAYAEPGYNSNVYDPMSNILASINYSLSRYGSLEKAWKGKGYATGGIINKEQLALLGEKDKEEVVIPLEQHKDRGLSLLSYAAEKLLPGTTFNFIPKTPTGSNSQNNTFDISIGTKPKKPPNQTIKDGWGIGYGTTGTPASKLNKDEEILRTLTVIENRIKQGLDSSAQYAHYKNLTGTDYKTPTPAWDGQGTRPGWGIGYGTNPNAVVEKLSPQDEIKRIETVIRNRNGQGLDNTAQYQAYKNATGKDWSIPTGWGIGFGSDYKGAPLNLSKQEELLRTQTVIQNRTKQGLDITSQLAHWKNLTGSDFTLKQEQKNAKETIKLSEWQNKEMAKIQKVAYADRLKSLEQWISKQYDLQNINIHDEIRIWEHASKEFGFNTEDRQRATVKLNDLQSKLAEEEKQRSEKLAKEEEERLNELRAKKTQYYNDIKMAAENYASQARAINERMIAEEQRLIEEYENAVNSRTSQLVGFAGLFDRVIGDGEEIIAVNGEELIFNLQQQITVLEHWTDQINRLGERNITQGLLEQLRDMGPNAIRQIEALNRLSEPQLERYSELWKEKNEVARKQAVGEMEGLKIETLDKINELRMESAKELDMLREDWLEEMKAITTGTTKEFDILNATMPDMGKAIIEGLMAGIDSKNSALMSKMKSVTDAIKSTLMGAFGINSPSRWMKDMIGKNQMQGWIDGIDGMKSKVLGTTNRMTEWMKPGIPEIPQGAGVSSDGIITNNNSTVTGDTVNNYYVTIPASDIKEFNNVTDFFSKLQQTKRSR